MRAAILQYIMKWGLAHMQRWTIDSFIPDGFRLALLLVGTVEERSIRRRGETHEQGHRGT